MKNNLMRISAMVLALVMSAACMAGCSTATNSTTSSTAAATGAATGAPIAESTSAATSAAQEPVTLTFWSWLPTTVDWGDMVTAFETENPNIKVDYTRTEQDDYFEKLQVAMASGTGPDLFCLTTGPMVDQYATFCDPMGALADSNMPDWKDVISTAAVDQCTTTDGTLAGMPLLVAGMEYMLYNDTLMKECGVDKVPTTYAELLDASAKIEAAGYVTMAMGAADDWHTVDWFVMASNQFEKGAVYEAEAGNKSWTDACFVDTMNAWAKLFNDGVFEDGALGVVTYPDARDQYFFDRKAVFFPTGSWHLGPTSTSNAEIEGTAIKEAGDVIGMTMFPQVGPGEFAATTGVDVLMSVNKDCAEKEAAMKFVQFMSEGTGQQMWVNKLQGSPVSNKITYQGNVDGELQQQSIDAINSWNANAVGARKLHFSELEKAIVVAMQNVAAGADAATELKTVQEVSNAIER